MKICVVCEVSKSEEEFFFRSKKTAKLHNQCKECYTKKRRQIWKDYYYKHGSKYRENAVARNKKIKSILRKNLYTYLSDKSCAECGITDIRVLEFDHLDSKGKSFGIATAISNTVSWNRILKEIRKCQILCANCHKIKTASEQGWYKT